MSVASPAKRQKSDAAGGGGGGAAGAKEAGETCMSSNRDQSSTRAVALLLKLDQDIANKIAAADGLRLSMQTYVDPDAMPTPRSWTLKTVQPTVQCTEPASTVLMTPPSSVGRATLMQVQPKASVAPPPRPAVCLTCASDACSCSVGSNGSSLVDSPEPATVDAATTASARSSQTAAAVASSGVAIDGAPKDKVSTSSAPASAPAGGRYTGEQLERAAANLAAALLRRKTAATSAAVAYNMPTREDFVKESAKQAADIIGGDAQDFVFRPNQQALIEAAFDGLCTAAILPVGGGKNLILNACARAAQALNMERCVIVEVSFFRTLIFAQLDEFGQKTTYVTPVEVEYERDGGPSVGTQAFKSDPSTAPHVVKGAVDAGKRVIVTTPEFLVGDSGRSINAREDVLDLVRSGRLLAVFIDEGQTFKLQRELRKDAFESFVQFVGQLRGTASNANKLLSMIVTTGTLPGSEPHELFQWLHIPLELLLRAPLDRPHITLAVDEIPAISTGEGADLFSAVLGSIAKFQTWFRNLPAKDQANVPCRSAMIIFLHRRSDVDAIAQKLNSDAAKACGCVCYLDCVANEGCRTRGLPRAVAYHSGLADDVKRVAFSTNWRGGVSAADASAFIIVSTSILEQGINRPHVIAALSPCGPPPTLSNLAQGIWGRTMRACAFPAFACVTWCYRLMWRLVYRAGSMEPGSPAFHGFNRVAKFLICSMRSCARDNLLAGLSCPTIGTGGVRACHDQCCSFGTTLPWQTRPRHFLLFKEATDRARLFIQCVNALTKESSWFPHASLGRVMGYEGTPPEWRSGLSECQSCRLMDSFIAPEAGLADIGYLYRPKGCWTVCVGVHTGMCADGDGLYHMAMF